MEEDEYKDTEIGKIPKDWEVIKLEEIFSPVNLNDRKVVIDPKKEYKLIKTTLYSKGVVLKDVVEGKKIKAKFMYELKDNDFIFSKINLKKGALGFVGSELEGSVVSSEHPILKLNTEKAYKDYIKYYFYQPNVWILLKAEAKGFSGKERIKIREFLLFKIVLPNFEEQKRIAYILSKIENAIKIQDRIINSLQELKKSMMRKLFTEGIGHTEFKDTEIGRIPLEWEIKTLKDIYTVKYGKSHKKSNNGEIPVIGSSGIYSYTDIYLAKSDVIIIGRKGNAGKVYFIDKNCWPSDTTFYIEPTTLLISKFTYYYLYNLNISGNDAKTTLPSLQKGTVESIILIIPPLEEQKRIADILSTIDNKISIEEDRKKYFEALFKTMLNKLMTGQIRVKNLEMRE